MKTKMRILHVIGGGEFGGAEQHILHLLKSFPQDEVEATVVCFYDSLFAEKLREANIPVIPLTKFGRFDIRVMRSLRQIIKDWKPDVVHSHGIKANFLARLAAYGLPPFVLTTVHSSLRYDYENPLVYRIVSLMERSTRALNQHYIVVSKAIGEILQQDGVASNQISLIYNGINLAPFQQSDNREQDRARLLREWGVPEQAFIFGSVARLVPVKGFHYLLEGFALFLQQQTSHDYHLILVGDGTERSSLEKLAVQLQIDQHVHFAGFRQDVPNCLHTFDVFVHSSIYEGLGYTLIEAMAADVPVIASSVGGVTEFVFPEETGLLIPPENPQSIANAMQRLAESSSLREELVSRADQLVQSTFTIEQMAAQTLELYRLNIKKV
ncbi:glycosyltransferase [Brevibacillus ginsengisoli]|uniref:glycosyltransferase n=1 Tax=Brevibacillus ginsengisoli TaxID=363854 RepID=UPI003CF78EE6